MGLGGTASGPGLVTDERSSDAASASFFSWDGGRPRLFVFVGLFPNLSGSSAAPTVPACVRGRWRRIGPVFVGPVGPFEVG